jgi:hypothetical protein
VFALIFWYKDDILLIDYLPKGQMFTVEYYSSLLFVVIDDVLKEKICGELQHFVMLLHENAPAQRGLATQK